MEDLELLQAWGRGERTAGDALILRYFDPVCRFFRTKLGDDVEDLIQRTFLDLLETVGKLEIDSVRAMVFTIAHRRLLDHLRTRYRAPIDQLSSLSVADLGTSPSGMVGRSEEERLLHQALRQISLDHQVVLELAYWEELNGPEIAQVLGLSEHTVRSRLSRARDALRDKLAQLAASPALAHSTLQGFTARAAR